ncbi:hypothetical protein BDW22DRAFT_1341513 [Trametopsis cervina]|nr:hypothetical protein BDW22DRAFT_1341513 [Trametopsis cervina]
MLHNLLWEKKLAIPGSVVFHAQGVVDTPSTTQRHAGRGNSRYWPSATSSVTGVGAFGTLSLDTLCERIDGACGSERFILKMILTPNTSSRRQNTRLRRPPQSHYRIFVKLTGHGALGLRLSLALNESGSASHHYHFAMNDTWKSMEGWVPGAVLRRTLHLALREQSRGRSLTREECLIELNVELSTRRGCTQYHSARSGDNVLRDESFRDALRLKQRRYCAIGEFNGVSSLEGVCMIVHHQYGSE